MFTLGTALLEYNIENKDIMNMYHTEVPSEYRGQGIAKHVVEVCNTQLLYYLEVVT